MPSDSNNQYTDPFLSINDSLARREIYQVVEEKIREENKKKIVLVQDKRTKALFDGIARRTDALIRPKAEDFWERKMVACGLDPNDEKVQLPKKYSYLSTKNDIDSAKFQETYPPGFITLLANAHEYDLYIKKAIKIKTQLITNNGEDVTIRMEPFTHLEQKDSKKSEALLNKFLKKAERDRLLEYLDNVLAFTRLYSKMNDTLTQKAIFGRGAALIERLSAEKMKANPMFADAGLIEGSPVYIKSLSTPSLGRILVDPSSWEVSKVWYNDAIFGKDENNQDKPGDWIDSKDMIYLVNDDVHIMPDRLHYGYSDLTPIMPLSETMRQVITEVLTEANINLVLPSIIFTFDDLDEKSIQKFIDNYRAGGIMGRNNTVGHEVINFAPNLEQILSELDYIKKMLNYGVGVPPIFSGSEELTNRSIADRVAEVWTLTELMPLRTEFSTAIYDQFFVPTIKNWMEKEKVTAAEMNDFVASKIRIITEFPKLDFSDMKERIDGLVALKTNMIATLGEARKMNLMAPYPDEMVEAMIAVENKLKEDPDMAEQILAFIKGMQQQQVDAEVDAKNEEIDANPNLDPDQKKGQKQLNEMRRNLDKNQQDVTKKVANNQF